MSDISHLVTRCQRGDDRAAETLYYRYRDATFRLAYGLLGDSYEAEEAAQDALIYALTRIHRYDAARASFATWLHTIAVSRCRDRQRKRRLATVPLMGWLMGGSDAADPSPSPERRLLQTEAKGDVWQAIQALSPPLREAIILRHWTDHTYAEIAAILHCPMGTAQSRVRLAYQRLRASLSPADLAPFQEEEPL